LDVSEGFGAKVEEALEEKPHETETRLRRRNPKPANPPQAEVATTELPKEEYQIVQNGDVRTLLI
jgi:hypothetical protein